MWITLKAVASPQAITVNGTEVTTEAYNIYDCNYFKLRDLAMMLSGTSAQFDVGYDEATRTAAITTGAVCTPEGSEMAAGADNSAICDVSNQKILLNGSPVSLTAYNIGGYNFIKLRDLAPLLGYMPDHVVWLFNICFSHFVMSIFDNTAPMHQKILNRRKSADL